MSALWLDEIALQRGQGKFVWVISAPALGRGWDLLEDRSQETLLKGLGEGGIEWGAAVQIACSDRWDAYPEAAEQKLPTAQRGVARFQRRKNLNEALPKARRTIQKDAEETPQALLKACRCLLVKNRENLTEAQQQKLSHRLAAAPELKSCSELKESFRERFHQNLTYNLAEKRLLPWMAKGEAPSFQALKSFANTLSNGWEPILNDLDGRSNHGFAEGVHLKSSMRNRRRDG